MTKVFSVVLKYWIKHSYTHLYDFLFPNQQHATSYAAILQNRSDHPKPLRLVSAMLQFHRATLPCQYKVNSFACTASQYLWALSNWVLYRDTAAEYFLCLPLDEVCVIPIRVIFTNRINMQRDSALVVCNEAQCITTETSAQCLTPLEKRLNNLTSF